MISASTCSLRLIEPHSGTLAVPNREVEHSILGPMKGTRYLSDRQVIVAEGSLVPEEIMCSAEDCGLGIVERNAYSSVNVRFGGFVSVCRPVMK